jgi:hypothetical protein
MNQTATIVACLLILGLSNGCVRRVIEITSDPDGATVWLNDREIGATPLEVEVVYYGTYDVQVDLSGFEPITTFGSANAPTWDMPGLDFFAEILPVSFESRSVWHYDLVPAEGDAEALLGRAEALQARVEGREE